MHRDGEEVATGARGIEDFLAMYGITWQAASVLFSRQRELDAFVYATPAERKTIFESLLQVESVNEARKIASQRQKDCAEDPDPILEEWTPESIQKIIDAREDEIAKQSNFVQGCEEQVETYKTERQEALDVLTAASADDAARRIQGLIRLANDKKSKIHRHLDQIEPTIKAAPVLDEVQVAKSTALVTSSESRIVAGQAAMVRAETQKEELRDERGRILGQIETLNKTIQQLKDGNCPTCGTHVDDP